MKVKTTVAASLSQAYSEFETLKDELESWYDGMHENLQGGSKGEELQTAMDSLGELSEQSCPEWLGSREIEVTLPHNPNKKRGLSRPKRAENELAGLREVLAVVQYEYDERQGTECEDLSELSELVDTLENDISVVEGISWPRMFG